MELAGKYSSVDEILAALKENSEFGLDEEGAMNILLLYKDTLSEELQKELEERV